MKKKMIALAALLLSATVAQAAPIDATVSAKGNGYVGQLGLLNDGNADTAVSWNGLGKVFTFEFDDLYRIDNLSLSVRGGGDYALEFSTDSQDWGSLLTVSRDLGGAVQGMKTLSTDSTDPWYVKDLAFTPVEARYVRIQATGKDNNPQGKSKDKDDQYAIAEIGFAGEKVVLAPVAQLPAGAPEPGALAPAAQAPAPVPEPGALALIALGLAGLGMVRRRQG